LKAVIRKYQPSLLIGASGTFDVVGAIVGREELTERYHEVDNQTVFQLINDIVIMNEKQRAQDPRIPASRIDMIVVALLLLKKVLVMGPFKKIGISTYALKEGVAASIFSLH
jgi:exopolyphosphatase/guanosine-5'-triphosphate,3'-diphosphate pyrophosphatase